MNECKCGRFYEGAETGCGFCVPRTERNRWETTTSTRPFRSADWMGDANCLGLDPDLFFGNNGETYNQLRVICMACSVRRECLDDALAFETSSDICGFRGGMGPAERREELKRRLRRPERAERAFQSLRMVR